MRESQLSIIERHSELRGRWETEPFETGWASELIYFVYPERPLTEDVSVRLQIAADGRRWLNDGESVVLRAGEPGLALRSTHFGGWSRIVLDLPESTDVRFDISLTLKE